jgi:hypothetical protein
MKKLLGVDIVGTATLSPGISNVGTVTFTGPVLGLHQLLIVTNVTRNVIVYNFADPDAGEAAYANNVLTLTANTATHSASDVLQVFVDVPEADFPSPSIADRTDNLLVMMSRIVKLLESNAVVDQQQRQRIAVDSFIATIPTLTTVTGVTTVSTVSSVTNIAANAGMDREQYINIAKQTYTQSIRNRLEFV